MKQNAAKVSIKTSIKMSIIAHFFGYFLKKPKIPNVKNNKKPAENYVQRVIGVREGSRTPDLSLRRRPLYPTELHEH